MSAWLNKFINALDVELVAVELVDHLDDILAWIGRGTSNQTYVALEKKYGSLVLFKRLENFLDALVVGDSAVGEMFPLILSDEDAKKRYRKLIRIFHPDKGASSQVWLNYRAEKINKAYQKFLDIKGAKEDLKVKESSQKQTDGSVKKTEVKQGKFHFGPKLRYRPSVWRERLGNPQQFQRKVLIVLIVCSLLLVLIVFLSNKKSDFEFGLNKNELSEIGNFRLENLADKNDYIVDLKAKEILREADEFLSDDELFFEEVNGNSSERFLAHVSDDSHEVEGLRKDNQQLVISNEIERKLNVVNEPQKKQNKKVESFNENELNIGKQNIIKSKKVFAQEQSLVVSKKIVNNQNEVFPNSYNVFASLEGFKIHIQQLKRYYELGDSDGTAGLYISSGRENDIRGSDKIRKYYRKAFAKTSNRKFDYVIDSIKQDKETAVVIQGRVDLFFSSKTLLRKKDRKINATFSVLLIKVGKEFKIASFDWKEV